MPDDGRTQYNDEIERLIPALEAKGDDEMTRALLAEVENARELIAEQTDPAAYDDNILQSVKKWIAGTLSSDACVLLGDALGKKMNSQDPRVSRLDKAIEAYQSSCTHLTLVEAEPDSPYFLCLDLIDFTELWTGCSKAAARHDLLAHLQAALDSQGQERYPLNEDRSRISPLAG